MLDKHIVELITDFLVKLLKHFLCLRALFEFRRDSSINGVQPLLLDWRHWATFYTLLQEHVVQLQIGPKQNN